MNKIKMTGWLALVAASALTTGAVLATPPTSQDCADCHAEVVDAALMSPHAKAKGWVHESSCSSCHGDGTEHIDSGGEISLIVRPAQLSSKESSQQCLSCHTDQKSHFRASTALHQLADVGCNDCHNPHSNEAMMLEKRGAELCSDCHQAQVAQFDMPRSHPMGQGGGECSNCHNPHGNESLRMAAGQANATCGNCHFEKTAPMVYAHDVALIDGCSSCHTVHGSTNRHLLKYETQVNLCYECHSASLTPTWHSVPRFLNEKCTACHTAIHGSNTSPYFLEE